jgi:hypothetical protein
MRRALNKQNLRLGAFLKLFHAHRLRIARWAWTIVSLGCTSLLVQCLNALAGFLIIRTLEKPPYAWFTIASGMMASLNILSDAGIGSAVTSIGGTVWNDKKRLSSLIRTALQARLRMAGVAVLLTAPLSMWLLLRTGCEIGHACILTLIVILPFWQISTTGILSIVNRLHSRGWQIQVAEVTPALFRASLVVALGSAGNLNATSALAVTVASTLVQFSIVRRQVGPLVDSTQDTAIAEEYALRIRATMRKVYPNSVFSCVQGQISIWLISIFAGNSEVAEFGALSRLGIFFAIFQGPLIHWIGPAFARATSRNKLMGITVGAFALLGGITIPTLTILILKPSWFLMILGPSYGHLQQELFLVVASMVVGSSVSISWCLVYAKGWVRTVWLNIPLTVLAQVITLSCVPVNSVSGVALFGLCVNLVQLSHGGAVLMSGILRGPSRTY